MFFLYVCLYFQFHDVLHSISFFICTDIYKFLSNRWALARIFAIYVNIMKFTLLTLDIFCVQNWMYSVFLSLFLLWNSLNLARIPSKVAKYTFKNYVSQTQVQDQNRLQFQWNTTASICNYPNSTALFKYVSLFKRMMTSLWFVHGPQNSPNINGYHVNIEMKIVYHSGEHYLKPNCFERNRQSDWLTMKSHRIFIGVWKTRLKSFCSLQGNQNHIF